MDYYNLLHHLIIMDLNRYEIHSIPSLVPDSAPPSSGLTPYRILSIASFVSYLYSSLTALSDLASSSAASSIGPSSILLD